MVQFYFLSVLLNILVGIILIISDNSAELDSSELTSSKSNLLNSLENDSLLLNETFDIIVGIICTFIGFLKLFFIYSNSTKIIIFGDFFPAVFGLISGLILVLDFYSKSVKENELPSFVETIFFAYKKYFGCCSILIGFLHFIFPGVLFL